MKKKFFKILARLNKWLLPSLSKNDFDMDKATKAQLTLIGWRYYVTKNSLDSD
ncbi:SsrA-binding protein [Aureibaculum conchae]|uniref:SsrA-binding protein n=1 Tax=Aureibaculum sp. 2308TA14-22 TaxID=3108392 RepID=UPI00339A0F76